MAVQRQRRKIAACDMVVGVQMGCCLLLPFAIDIFHGSNAFLRLSLVQWLGTESERERGRERGGGEI
jgi:hypothetical protein